MKNVIALLVFFSFSAAFAADCEPTSKVYSGENDDVGTTLPLIQTCKGKSNPADTVCAYSDGQKANVQGTINGQWIGSGELYSRSLTSNDDTLKIVLKTTSLFDHIKLSFSLNKNTNEASVTYNHYGVDPFKGLVSYPELAAVLNCR